MTDPRRDRRPWKAMLGCAVMLVSAGLCESGMQPVGISHGYLRIAPGRNAALAEAAGEFRVAAANVLWGKVVDHYHHQYMAEGGDWDKNESLLPLLQTIITLDPHFVEAYQLMGGTILPKTGRIAQGKAVLAQGIKNNPYDWEMYREMAMVCAWTEKKPETALPYAQEGLKQADDDFSRHLMTMLCHTLQKRIQEDRAAKKPQVTALRPSQRPRPDASGTIPPDRPSASG